MDSCLFLTGGSTQGVHAALALACKPGETVLLDRGSHRSAYNALALLDLEPRPTDGTALVLDTTRGGVVNALYQECRDLLFASITDPQGEDLPPREAFHAMFGRYIRTALEHREEFLFVEQYHLSPVISEEGRIGTDFRLGQRSLTELTRDGVLRDLDPLILDAVVLGTANQLLCLHFAGHLALDDAAIRAALDACWHAIAAAPRLTE